MSVTLVKGDDPVLVDQAVSRVVDDLLAGGDRSLMLEEVTETQHLADGDPELTALVNAAHTPPFLTDRRVVVGRHLSIFTRADQVAGLVGWLESPLPTTDLVLVWEKPATSDRRSGAIPKSLKEALKAAGAVEVDAAPKGRGRSALVADKLADAPVRLDRGAQRLITDTIGDDAGRIDPLLEVLVSSFGETATLGADDVAPFLGAASDVPPWELTDAIDSADIGVALDRLRRMLGAGERHGLQVMATLHNHYQRALALDGADVANEKDAAALLGIKGSTFPAKKALGLARRLGHERLVRAVDLLAAADLDLRGHSAVDADTTMEVLVARLAANAR